MFFHWLRRLLWKGFAFVALLSIALQSSAPESHSQETAAGSDIAVIVNAKNPMSDVSFDALRKIVLGEMATWKDHVKIVLVLRQEGTPERDIALRVLAKMTSSEFKKYWRERIFRAESDAEPLTVPSKGLLLEYIGEQKGGVAFLQNPDLKVFPNVKVVTVNGMKSGDAKYPLR